MSASARRRRGALFAIVVVGVAVAAVLWLREPRDPYLAHLEERIAALRPDVERELGAEIPGPIRVVVSTRRELGELQAREKRAMLTAIEGEPPPDVPDDVQWTVLDMLGMVDADETIHICRQSMQGAPRADGVGRLLDRAEDAGQDLGPEVLDWTLVHELVHVFQKRVLDSDEFRRRSRHRTDLLARRAVLEGHAELVTARVLGADSPVANWMEGARSDSPSEAYFLFDIGSESWNDVFAYAHGREFVEAAFRRLGPADSLRRMFAEPPSVYQVEHPGTWPGPGGPASVSDAMRRRMRGFLVNDWDEVRGGPRAPSAFLYLCGNTSPETQAAVALELLDVQRIEASGDYGRRSLAGHLLAAASDDDAELLLEAWGEAASARDDLTPSDPKLWNSGVLTSTWSEAEIDGGRVLLARRTYHDVYHVEEHAVVATRGRHVLELRLVDGTGPAAALRLARRLLACVVDDPDASSPDASGWDMRWRFAGDSSSDVERVRGLLTDPDADVRHAALTALLRRDALSAAERDRARDDSDPLVRLTALTWCVPDGEIATDDLLRAVRDADPWVAAGGLRAAVETYGAGAVPHDDVASALRRPESFVRRAAARVLGGLDWRAGTEEEWLALARDAMTDDDPGVRERARGPLLHIDEDTPGLVETIVEILEGSDDDAKEDVLRSLTIRERVPGIAHALVPLLDDEQHCDDAATVLGKLRKEARPAVPALRRLAEEARAGGDAGRRLGALRAVALITYDPTEWVDAVRDSLVDGTDEEAMTVAWSVRDSGRLLQRRLQKEMPDLVPTLVRRLDTDDRRLKRSILSLLQKLGRAAAPALPAVRALRDGGDPFLRPEAVLAIRAMEGQSGRSRDGE